MDKRRIPQDILPKKTMERGLPSTLPETAPQLHTFSGER